MGRKIIVTILLLACLPLLVVVSSPTPPDLNLETGFVMLFCIALAAFLFILEQLRKLKSDMGRINAKLTEVQDGSKNVFQVLLAQALALSDALERSQFEAHLRKVAEKAGCDIAILLADDKRVNATDTPALCTTIREAVALLAQLEKGCLTHEHLTLVSRKITAILKEHQSERLWKWQEPGLLRVMTLDKLLERYMSRFEFDEE